MGLFSRKPKAPKAPPKPGPVEFITTTLEASGLVASTPGQSGNACFSIIPADKGDAWIVRWHPGGGSNDREDGVKAIAKTLRATPGVLKARAVTLEGFYMVCRVELE
jgi:hypothetical protein